MKPWESTEVARAKRDNRIVYLRDKSHLVSGGEPLTWKAISERFGLDTEAAIRGYKRSKRKNAKKLYKLLKKEL